MDRERPRSNGFQETEPSAHGELAAWEYRYLEARRKEKETQKERLELKQLVKSFGTRIARLCIFAEETLQRFSSEDPSKIADELESEINSGFETAVDQLEHWKTHARERDEALLLKRHTPTKISTWLQGKGLPEHEDALIKSYLLLVDRFLKRAPGYIEEQSVEHEAAVDAQGQASFLAATCFPFAYPLFGILAEQETEIERPRFDRLRNETLSFLLEAVPTLDRTTIERRAQALKLFRLYSTTDAGSSEGEWTAGIYNVRVRGIGIRVSERRNALAYRHEILHGLSHGIRHDATDLSDPELTEEARSALTEAIIEELSLFGEPGTEHEDVSYPRERADLSKIRKTAGEEASGGVPFFVFAEALFSEDKSLRNSLRRHGHDDTVIEKILRFANLRASEIKTQSSDIKR